jgi:hypothetical protein
MTEKSKDQNQIPQKEVNAKVYKPIAEKELGGRKGPDPTRYGDWELNGKCVDF